MLQFASHFHGGQTMKNLFPILLVLAMGALALESDIGFDQYSAEYPIGC